MKKIIVIFIIFFVSITITSCSGGTDDSLNSSTSSDTDTTAPILSEVTAVTTPTNDTTPNYTFSSTEEGTITYGGSCTSSTTSASFGNNAITFNTLSNGIYDNCTIMVTDNASNSSSNLPVSTFTIDNTTISSSASDNSSVAFGQTYQYQLTINSAYPGTISYSLDNSTGNLPDGMTISPSGLIEWTPTKASQITTHSNITIKITTASGYVLTETYDLTVTGTCTSGNVLSIWSEDQRSSTDSSKFLGNITAYTDNASDTDNASTGDICGEDNDENCTAANNYDYRSSSLHLTHGPTPSATKGSMFFYNQYDNTTDLYLFFFFGDAGNSNANTLKLDVFSDNNTSTDNVVVTDDSGETTRYTSSSYCGTSPRCYKGRYSYNSENSDGAVLGPYTGSNFRIFIDLGGTSTINSDTLTLGNLDSFKYFSKDNSSFSLGSVDNFTVGFNTTMDCNN